MNSHNDSLWQTADSAAASEPGGEIVLQVNGQPVAARSTDTVATALLRAGYAYFGCHVKTGRPLAPGCLMGVCFGCLCTIDGRTGMQACLEPVRDGLVISTDSTQVDA